MERKPKEPSGCGVLFVFTVSVAVSRCGGDVDFPSY